MLRQIIHNGFHSNSEKVAEPTYFHAHSKAQGHVTVNKPVISMIYIVSHTWPLCSAQILVDGVNPR